MWTEQLATTVDVILWVCGVIAALGAASMVIIKAYQYFRRPGSATLKLIESNQEAIQQNQSTLASMVVGQKFVYSGMLAMMNSYLHPDDPVAEKETQEAYTALKNHIIDKQWEA